MNIFIHFQEISMPYSLNFFNPIKKYEWQDKSIKVSHDRFMKSTDNAIYYKNSIAIDLDKYEDYKNEIIQFLDLPDNYEMQIKPYGRKGVKLGFYILPTYFTLEKESYKRGLINYGVSVNGMYYIDILKQTHLICVGESGSGKSNLMHHILQSIFINENIINSIFLIDLKGTELYRYRNRDKVNFIDTVEGVRDILKILKLEMNNRFKEMKSNNEVMFSGDFKFVFIDEIGTIGTNPNKKLRDEIFAIMIELLQKARAAKIIFFIFAQKIDSTNIPSNVLANIQSRILMKTDSDFNINNTIGKKEDLEKITRVDIDSFPRGRAIYKDGITSEKVLLQAPFIEL